MIRQIQTAPSPGLERLAAIYCVFLTNKRRPQVSFYPTVGGQDGEIFVVHREVDWKRIPQPDLPEEQANNLKRIIGYCRGADHMRLSHAETAVGSLKWTITAIRERGTGGSPMIWEAFLTVADKIVAGHVRLFRNGADVVLSQNPLLRPFLDRRSDPDLGIQGVRLEQVGPLLAALYEGGLVLTSRAFDETLAAVYLFHNPTQESAGIIVRSQEWRPDVDLKQVRQFLPANEKWTAAGEGNVLICGGRTAPQNTTVVSLEDLKEALRKRLEAAL